MGCTGGVEGAEEDREGELTVALSVSKEGFLLCWVSLEFRVSRLTGFKSGLLAK